MRREEVLGAHPWYRTCTVASSAPGGTGRRGPEPSRWRSVPMPYAPSALARASTSSTYAWEEHSITPLSPKPRERYLCSALASTPGGLRKFHAISMLRLTKVGCDVSVTPALEIASHQKLTCSGARKHRPHSLFWCRGRSSAHSAAKSRASCSHCSKTGELTQLGSASSPACPKCTFASSLRKRSAL